MNLWKRFKSSRWAYLTTMSVLIPVSIAAALYVAMPSRVMETFGGTDELDCLAAGVYAHAHGKSLHVQKLVAQTILNRARHDERSVCTTVRLNAATTRPGPYTYWPNVSMGVIDHETRDTVARVVGYLWYPPADIACALVYRDTGWVPSYLNKRWFEEGGAVALSQEDMVFYCPKQ